MTTQQDGNPIRKLVHCSDVKVIVLEEHRCYLKNAKRCLSVGDHEEVLLISGGDGTYTSSALEIVGIDLTPCPEKGGGMDQPVVKVGEPVNSAVCDPDRPGECIIIPCPHVDQHIPRTAFEIIPVAKTCRGALGEFLCPPATE